MSNCYDAPERRSICSHGTEIEKQVVDNKIILERIITQQEGIENRLKEIGKVITSLNSVHIIIKELVRRIEELETGKKEMDRLFRKIVISLCLGILGSGSISFGIGKYLSM